MLVIAVGIGGPMKDLDVYLLAGRAFGKGADLYADGFGHGLSTPLPYTYPPSWAAALALVAWLPRGWVGLGWTLLNAALLLWVTRVSYRAFLDAQGAAWPVALACMAGIMAFSAPVLSVFDLGQVGILLLAMVLADTVPERTRLPRGVLVGAATAIKLTPGVVVAYWIATKRWRAAGVAIATTAGIWALTALLRPDLSHTYWLDIAIHPTRAGDLACRDRPIDERPAAAARMDRRRALGGVRGARARRRSRPRERRAPRRQRARGDHADRDRDRARVAGLLDPPRGVDRARDGGDPG